MRKMVIIFATVALAAGIATGALAQGIDGTLRGEVDDSKGGIIAGAKVTITNEQTGLQRSQETSSGGTFSFPNLLVGTYTITVEYPGFKKFVRKGVEVKANQVSEAKVSMEIGIVTETVEVVAGAELVQTTSSQLGTSWGSRQLTDLPLPTLDGNPQNLALFQTGTTSQSGGIPGEGGSIGGNRPRQNNFVLDGVDNNDIQVTGPNQPVIPDAIGEFTLLTNQFSAEYGHSTAGQFIQTSKSGTNVVHGDAFWYGANKEFNSLDNLTKSAIALGNQPGKPRFDLNRLGATAGGPILKDKLFYFGAYQHTGRGVAATAGSQVFTPTAAGFTALNTLAGTSGCGVSSGQVTALSSIVPVAPTSSQTVPVVCQSTGVASPIPIGPIAPAAPSFLDQHQFNVNADLNLKDHRVSGRYSYDRQRQPDVGALPVPAFTGSSNTDHRSVIFSDAFTINPRVVNEFRVGYRRTFFAFAVPSLTPPGGLDVYPNFVIQNLGGLELGPDGNAPQSSVLNAYQASNTLSVARGTHNFKLGVDFRLWIAPSLFLPRARAEYRYSSLDRFVKDALPDNLALRGVGDGGFAGNEKGIYWFVQDDWKVFQRLTLNLGIRYEFVTNPRDDRKQLLNAAANLTNPTNPGLPPLIFGVPRQDRNDFSPRIGFAYDVFGDHKTSLRGGFAIAYDVIFQNLPLLQLPPQLQQELDPGQACALTPPPTWCPLINGGLDASGPFVARGGLPGTFVPQTLTPTQARNGTQGLIVDTVTPETYTWSLSAQRELWRDWSVELRYVGTRGIRLPVQIRRNARVVPPANLFLPVFFRTSDVPANVPLTAPNVMAFSTAAVRPYAVDSFLGNVTAFDPVGNSFYHAGSVEVTRRLSGLSRYANGLFIRTGYTYSKAIDDSTSELFTTQVNPRRPEDFGNLRNERGPSAIDHRHKYTLATIWELPRYGGSTGFVKALFNAWEISASYIAETGQPVDALSFIDANGNGDAAGDRAILNPNGSGFTATDVNAVCRTAAGATTVTIVTPAACSSGLTVGYVAVDPTAQYVRARPGSMTNIGRNTLFSAGLNNWNLGFMKKTNINERMSVQFQAEMINAFNHQQPILGSGTISGLNVNAIGGTDLSFVGNNPNFQKPANIFSSGAGKAPFSRLIQFGLKFIF